MAEPQNNPVVINACPPAQNLIAIETAAQLPDDLLRFIDSSNS